MLACCAVFLTIISKLKLALDSTWLWGRRQEGRGSWEACDWWSRWESLWRIWGGGGRRLLIPVRPCRLEEGTSSAVVREPLPAPGSKKDNGSRALTSDCLPLSPSHPVLLWDGRKSQSCIVIQEKTWAQTKNLPSAVWMKQFLNLAEGVWWLCHQRGD